MCITGISMPDELQMVRELPMDWISTMSYEKAQKWVKMHTPRKQMIYAQSSSSFLVLTTYGEECFKSLTKKLRKGYVALIPHDIHDIQRDTPLYMLISQGNHPYMYITCIARVSHRIA